MPASPSIQQIPEFAATTPSKPFPATAVDITFGFLPYGDYLGGCVNFTLDSKKGPPPEIAAKMFISQHFHGCHGTRGGQEAKTAWKPFSGRALYKNGQLS